MKMARYRDITQAYTLRATPLPFGGDIAPFGRNVVYIGTLSKIVFNKGGWK